MRVFGSMLAVSMSLLISACVMDNGAKPLIDEVAVLQKGCLSVSVRTDEAQVKSLSAYDVSRGVESMIHKVDVLVFDASTCRLERSAAMCSADEECVFELPVGRKLIYAVVNGPDVGRVRSLSQLMSLNGDLASTDCEEKGFAMLGSVECVVDGGVVEAAILVRRQVARVELRSIKCNLAPQYDGMKVECAFLGNAFSVQSLAGNVSDMVNVGGYSDVERQFPIGLEGNEGKCSEYMFRTMNKQLNVGELMSEPVFLYCQPDGGEGCTCLYLLTSIDGNRYYYRVLLDRGLASNTTCVVEAVVTNLGAPLPPDGVIQKGEIVATVTVEDWRNGDVYHADF